MRKNHFDDGNNRKDKRAREKPDHVLIPAFAFSPGFFFGALCPRGATRARSCAPVLYARLRVSYICTSPFLTIVTICIFKKAGKHAARGNAKPPAGCIRRAI
jgi:hypothetical protein